VRDTTVSRFNPPAEPAQTVGFGKRDSARTVGFGNQAANAREIPEEPSSERTRECVRACVYLWPLDAEKSDGKKKSDDGHREKWREKDKTTVGWRAFEVLRARSWNLALRAWNPGPESQVLKPRVEVLKPRSWYPGPETSRWDPETQVLRAKYRGPETQVLRACVRY
jgi:hypothetical protein